MVPTQRTGLQELCRVVDYKPSHFVWVPGLLSLLRRYDPLSLVCILHYVHRSRELNSVSVDDIDFLDRYLSVSDGEFW